MEIYLDNSATTKPYPEVIDAMTLSMREEFYNPSALYAKAAAAERALDAAREAVAAPLSMKKEQVVFTSGGTESNNLAILGHLKQLRGGGTVLYSGAEHAAVRNACAEAEAMGFVVKQIPLDRRGSLDLQALETMLDPSVRLLCVIQVCNETGVIMPLDRVVSLRDRLAPQAAVHVDGVQGYLRVKLNMRQLNIQSYAVSAHKVHGPKGVGALILREGHKIGPLLFGGGQQRGLRPGTDNTAGAAGFAAAVKARRQAGYDALPGLKAEAVKGLLEAVPGAAILGPLPEDPDSAPHILCVALPPVKAETMVHALEAVGVIVGTGAACSSRSRKPSAVLTAMNVSPELMDCAIRLSFSAPNTIDEIHAAVRAIAAQYAVLSRFTRR
jgi:cysteine desulfurase